MGSARPLVLFCGDPLSWTSGGTVDPAYSNQAIAAERAGFAIALLDFEALVDARDAQRATRRDGTWIIIELRDGQVSGLPMPELRQSDFHEDLHAEELYINLAKRWPR